MQALDVDYLAFSFHKLLAPFGVGVLYAKEHLLEQALPFLYGGDMIADGQVTPHHVAYNTLPWKYLAGTPDILGVIASAHTLRLLLDLVHGQHRWFRTTQPIPRHDVAAAMNLITQHTQAITERALHAAHDIPGLTIYGPAPGQPRSPLLAFNLAGTDPMQIAEHLNRHRVESRAGCHCATLAHHDLALTPPASCRLSFALYTNPDEVDHAVAAVTAVAAGRRMPAVPRYRPRWPGARSARWRVPVLSA